MTEGVITGEVEHKTLEDKLMELYKLMVPFSDLPYSTYREKCKEMYKTFALRDKVPYEQFIDASIMAAKQKKGFYSS